MNPKPTFVTSLCAIGCLLAGARGAPVEVLALDPHQPIEIGVGSRSSTTLQFPRPLQALFGYGLTEGNAPGTYHYAHPAGSRLLTLRNLLPDKETYVTVLLGDDDLYVLHLKPSASAPVAVWLVEADDRTPLARPINPDEAEAHRLAGGTERLFNLLKLGKNERVFRAALPHLYRDAESRSVEYRHDDGEVATVVTAIHRFPSEDAIFLGGEIHNATDTALFFDPGSIEVKVGARSYPAALVDCADVVPTAGSIPIHLILRGGVEGERAHLSIKNEFRIVLPAYGEERETPALTDALGLVVEPPGDEPVIDPALFGDSEPATVVTDSAKGGSK